MKINKKADLQRNIFDSIRKQLPSRFELARDVSRVLGISTDSVYRRIRGEKNLSLPETVALCKAYNLPIIIGAEPQTLQNYKHSFNNLAEEFNSSLKMICDYSPKNGTT